MRGRITLLNELGQERLERAFAMRSRPRASFNDFAEGYIRALQDEGTLLEYLQDGIDPFEVLEWHAEMGQRSNGHGRRARESPYANFVREQSLGKWLCLGPEWDWVDDAGKPIKLSALRSGIARGAEATGRKATLRMDTTGRLWLRLEAVAEPSKGEESKA